MKYSRSLPSALAVAAAVVLASPAWAVPTTMTYAGVLADSGVLVSAVVNVTFKLFDAETAGTELYSEDQTGLVVVGGDLIADIGQNVLDDALLDTPELWLQVTVDGDVLDPRVRLETVPYAFHADLADDARNFGGVLPAGYVVQSQLTQLHIDQPLSGGAGITFSNGVISIANGAITSAQIANGAIVDANVSATAAINGNKLAFLTVGSFQLGIGAVTPGKIAAGTIANADVSATAGILGSKLANGSVTSTQLSNGAVAAGRIAAGTIVNADISTTAAIAGSKLATGAIGSAQLAANAVTSGALNGIEVSVFILNANCATPALTNAATCQTVRGGCGAGQFQACNGGCFGSFTPATCSNALVGKLLSPAN